MRSSGSIGVMCNKCNRGWLIGIGGQIRGLSKNGIYKCDNCGENIPLEIAYIDMLKSGNLCNTLILCNHEEFGKVHCNIGEIVEIKFSKPLNYCYSIMLQGQEHFPLFCAIVSQSKKSFSFITSVDLKYINNKNKTVKVIYRILAQKGSPLPIYFHLLGKAFQVINKHPYTPPDEFRIAVIESIIAWESFVSWYIQKYIFNNTYFNKSQNKYKKIEQFIRDSGITNLTEVVIRTALKEINLYKIFELLKLSCTHSQISADQIIDSIIKGIVIRNKIIHRGLLEVDRSLCSEIIGNIYFAMESLYLNCNKKEKK